VSTDGNPCQLETFSCERRCEHDCVFVHFAWQNLKTLRFEPQSLSPKAETLEGPSQDGCVTTLMICRKWLVAVAAAVGKHGCGVIVAATPNGEAGNGIVTLLVIVTVLAPMS